MAFRVMRNKRNQRWTQRLQEIFQEWDKSQTGYISLDSMIEIYRIYKVELKVEEVRPRLDKAGNIRKNDFIEFSIECKLLDLTERKTTTETPKKPVSERRRDTPGPGPGLLCCLPARKHKKDTAMDRVEAAFRKFDSDGDGYIDWEEFKQVAKNLDPDQAERIFETLDSSGDRKISLEEFRSMANMGGGPAATKSG